MQSARKNGDFQNKNRTYWDRWQYRDDYSAYPNNREYENGDNRNTYRSGKAEVKETRRLNGTDYEVIIHDWDVDIDKFPTRDSGSTNPCAVFSDNNCKLNEGVISMLVFRTFTPSELNGTSLPEHYNASIMLRQQAQVTGMRITSQTGVEVTVLFTAPDGKDWGLWKVTTVKADGVDESRNNDATSISTEDLSEGAHISDVKRFPNVEEMTTSRFVVSNEDLGIVHKNGPVFALPATGYPWLLIVLAAGVVLCASCWVASRRSRGQRA